MAEQSSVFTGPETPEALLAQRQKFWHGFTNATMGVAIFVALLLIAMAVFLL
jgi:hypothetical protein